MTKEAIQEETIQSEHIEIMIDDEQIPLDPLAALNAENEIKTAQIAELTDKNLRLLAEMDNLRRRTMKEVADGRVYGVTNFAKDLLAVYDNLGRAVEAASETSGEEGLKGLLDGVSLIQKELGNVFAKNNIKEIIPTGEKFDPNFHQAMFEIPTAEVEAGTVLQVAQSGFVIGERTLRPALVGVAKKI